eukprot:14329559-Alexandrium_andersonii.AAC.1
MPNRASGFRSRCCSRKVAGCSWAPQRSEARTPAEHVVRSHVGRSVCACPRCTSVTMLGSHVFAEHHGRLRRLHVEHERVGSPSGSGKC